MVRMNFKLLTDDIIVATIRRVVGVDVFVDDGLFLHLLGQEGEDAGVVPAGREGVQLLLVVADDELGRVETESVQLLCLQGKIRRLSRHLIKRKQG